MYTAVVIPTLNEAEGVTDTFVSLANQTMRPDHIVIADGGSDDGTSTGAQKLGEYSGIPVTVAEKDGANIGFSCQAGVDLACMQMEDEGYDDGVIVRTDADSFLSSNWIERSQSWLSTATQPACYGSITVPRESIRGSAPVWERVNGWWYAVFSNANPKPKGRGMAFTKQTFEDVGGYMLCEGGECVYDPEWYEDTIFIEKCEQSGGRVCMDPRAYVATEMPTTTLSSPSKWGGSWKVKKMVSEMDWKPA